MLDVIPDYTGDKDLEKTLRDIELQKKQLWVIDDLKAVLITEVLSNGTCLLYMVAGEGVNDWGTEVITHIEKWAKGGGCHTVLAVGRKGWEKVGKPFGYEVAYTTFRKRI